jgi:hypothetical protein
MRAPWTLTYLRFHIREVIAALAIVAIVAGFLVLSMLPYRSPNFGFGPGWDCTRPGQGDPVCVKRGTDQGNP